MSKRLLFRALAVGCILGVTAAACGGGDDADSAATTTTSPPAPTTTAAPPPDVKEPLTGRTSTDAASLDRPALVAKIDNADNRGCADNARPQLALDEADVVYELMVESITRFAAVYHSRLPEAIGPVRSARSSDIDIIAQFNVPLLAWSGNNPGVGQELNRAADTFVNVGHSSAAGRLFYRDKNRCAPHNLFVSPAALYEFAEGEGNAPNPIFQYRGTGSAPPAAAAPVAGARLTVGREVVYTWNAESTSWDRTQSGTPHVVVGDRRISPTNVVVAEMSYTPSSSDPRSPKAVSVGRGQVHVYTAGTVVAGTWERETAQSPWTLRDEAGAVIELEPGTTWVSFAPAGRHEVLASADAVAKYLKS
jgi:hypothetical protein